MTWNAETFLQILAVTTAIAMALHAAIPALKTWAAATASKRDDDAVSKLEVVLDWVIRACDVARRFIPRVVVGPSSSTQPVARSLPPRVGDTLPGPPPLGVEPMKPLSVPPPREHLPPALFEHKQHERERLIVSIKRDDETPIERVRNGESER